MAAPKGNQFWKRRSKHGRDKLFATPDLLWEAACEYFKWCDEHPIEFKTGINRDKAGKKQYSFENIAPRPYSLTGLCIYLGCNTAYLRQLKRTCSEDFNTLLSCIEEIIETQQFEGAAVGAFNANIIARKLGMPDAINIKQENIIKGMTKDQVAEILSDDEQA